MIGYLLIGFAAGTITASFVWAVVYRRRLRTLQAEKAEEMLASGNRVAGIELPEASDPRWTAGEAEFTTSGRKHAEKVLYLGKDLFVELDSGAVYVGVGQALPGGPVYGNKVIRAYRQRLADEAKKGSS
jgi:hypothetical protein